VNDNSKIEQAEKEWVERTKDLQEHKPEFTTDAGIPVKRLYTPADTRDIDYIEDIGFPGEPPYARGAYSTMYRGRPWTIRLFSGHGTAEETNERWKMLYKHGQTGFSAAPDVLTFNGIEPDDPRSEAEVGTEGVPLYSIRSLEALVDGLPIDKISTALVVEPLTAAPVCAAYFNVAKNRGVNLQNLMGTTQNDILTMTIGYVGYNMVPPAELLKLACDFIEFCTADKQVPRWHPINFTGYNYREGGIDAVQELAFVFTNAIEHINELLGRGRKIEEFINRFAFHLGSHRDFFEEIAKFRAARKIWYKILSNRYGVTNPELLSFKTHVQTAGSSLTSQQPMNNVTRTAFQALAAILGGVQSLHTNSYDEAICLPSEEAVTVALRTQQIILAETGVANTIDPLAGSYFVESLTAELEKRVWDYIAQIEAEGGVVKTLESGWIYREMNKAFHKRQTDQEIGKELVVGVNCHVSEVEEEQRVFRTNPRAAEIETERIRKLRAERDNSRVEQLLDELRGVCETRKNVMPVVMELMAAGATIAEVCAVYREVWGIWKPNTLSAVI
jgi:methylmalonyl-CoA mutase N-terminal domain/subunit